MSACAGRGDKAYLVSPLPVLRVCMQLITDDIALLWSALVVVKCTDMYKHGFVITILRDEAKAALIIPAGDFSLQSHWSI